MYLFKNAKTTMTVISKDIDVALAAPMIPNFGISVIFRAIFIRAHSALILNAIFTFPILDNAPPTEMVRA